MKSEQFSIMSRTRVEEIKKWLDRGVAIGATHVVVMLDTFALESYPNMVMPGEDAKTIAADRGGDKVLEIYDLSRDIDAQLNEHRAWNV